MFPALTGVAVQRPRTYHWLVSWLHAKRQRKPLALLARKVDAAVRRSDSLLSAFHAKRERDDDR